MSKILAATCKEGVVKVGQLVISDVTVLSEGVGESTGILIIEEDEKTYLAFTSGDLKTLLMQLTEALGELTSALTAIDTKTNPTTCLAGPGTTIAAPVAASEIGAIEEITSELEDFTEVLK